jgi:hypothetical protein
MQEAEEKEEITSSALLVHQMAGHSLNSSIDSYTVYDRAGVGRKMLPCFGGRKWTTQQHLNTILTLKQLFSECKR